MRPLEFRNCVGQADDLKAGGKTVGDRVNCGLLVPARDRISEPITLLDLDISKLIGRGALLILPPNECFCTVAVILPWNERV